MIYGIAIWLITLVADIWTDLRRWSDGRGVNHFRGAMLRGFGLVPACWLAGWFSGVLLVAYWILFNGVLARMKGLPWLYLGNTSVIDRLLNKLPKLVYVMLQVILMAAAIYVYITRPL